MAMSAKQQAEADAYGDYLNRYSNQEHLKARPARTGWTRTADDYKICLWGSSLEDWFLFIICFLVLYASLILFYYLLLQLYLTNVEDNVATYIFFAIGFVAAAALALVVHWGDEEREMREKAAEEEAHRIEAELDAAANAVSN